MHEPSPHPFLSARTAAGESSPHAVLFGLCADGGVSFRPGAAEAPRGIREYSESIETYSPRQRRDLSDLVLLDAGDHRGAAAESHDVAAALLDEVWREGRRPLLAALGGDHSVTPPVVRAVAERSDGLAVVGFDAHLDLRETYEGDHACTYRRIAEHGIPCVVLGPRSGERSEWADAPEVLASLSPDIRLSEDARGILAGREVYVTIDIDVLDPAAAPGTGNPEPGGPSSREFLDALDTLDGLNVVAFDVVEVSPPLDPSGITQAAAAVIVREMLLRFGRAG